MDTQPHDISAKTTESPVDNFSLRGADIQPKPHKYQHISEQLLELIQAKATTRIQICAMLEICQPTLKKRLRDHNWKEWMVERMARRLRLMLELPHELIITYQTNDQEIIRVNPH